MTNEQILKKAIEKAFKGGFSLFDHNIQFDGELDVSTVPNELLHKGYYRFIFSHDFAKAFWGERCIHCLGKKHNNYAVAWEESLRIMVSMKEPLKYLEMFI